jgi:hypothetical protein
MKHELKIKRQHYEEIIDLHKTFEIRYNDRRFKNGDWLLLREILEPDNKYSGEEMMIRILKVKESEFLISGYVILYLDIDNMFYYNVK